MMKEEEVVNCQTSKSGLKYPVYEKPSEDCSVSQTYMPACSTVVIYTLRRQKAKINEVVCPFILL